MEPTETTLPQKLEEPRTFTSTIVKGEGKGKTIGFPTANFQNVPSTRQLPLGIYFGSAKVITDSKKKPKPMPCLIYFGPRYILLQDKNNFEVYIYKFSKDIYKSKMTVKLTHYLREPKNTQDKDELVTLIKADKKMGQELIDAAPKK
jgi:riboflavin kinase / FMN adenylyltransferase